MTKLFIDSDTILDLLLKRTDYRSAAKLLTRIEQKKYKGYTTPLVMANVHYIMAKHVGKEHSIKKLRKLRKILMILPITETEVDGALDTDSEDFEDAIQYLTSERNKVDFIITRNKKDYKESKLPALTAEEFMEIEIAIDEEAQK